MRLQLTVLHESSSGRCKSDCAIPVYGRLGLFWLFSRILAGFFSAADRLSKIRLRFRRPHFPGGSSAAGQNSADPDIRRRLGTLYTTENMSPKLNKNLQPGTPDHTGVPEPQIYTKLESLYTAPKNRKEALCAAASIKQFSVLLIDAYAYLSHRPNYLPNVSALATCSISGGLSTAEDLHVSSGVFVFMT